MAGIGRFVVYQRFTKTSTAWVEGVYTFPLPEDSTGSETLDPVELQLSLASLVQ